ARSTKNADRGGLLALGGRLRMRGCRYRGDMGGIAGMFGYGRLENGARVGIAFAAKLVELRHVLLEQATLGLGRDVSFHDGDDVVPQFLARDVARKITLVSRKSACGRGGNRERRPGHLQKSDQVFRGHRHLRSTLTTMPPWRENGNVGADGDCAVAERWRAPSRLRETCATRSGRSAATGRRREA